MQTVEEGVARPARDRPGRRDRLDLVVASFLMLFVELALIRGTVVNVVYLSFFTNLVLLASFLGIGVGFLRAGPRSDRFAWAPAALGLFVAFILLFPARIGPKGTPKILGLGGLPALPEWLSIPLVFLGVVGVMAAIAGRVASLFGRFGPLEAYRLDLLGSIGGIAAFSALSFAGADPLAWSLVAAVTFLALLRRELRPIVWVGVAVLVELGTVISLAPRDAWSPYQRV